MATQPVDHAGMTEPCEECGHDTPHSVQLELKTESSKPENAQFSREPYRTATCMECGAESVQRMNDA